MFTTARIIGSRSPLSQFSYSAHAKPDQNICTPGVCTKSTLSKNVDDYIETLAHEKRPIANAVQGEIDEMLASTTNSAGESRKRARTAKEQSVANVDAKPEGVSRRRARDLVGICFDHAFFPQYYYMSHVARGKWQDELMRKLREKLTSK